MLDPIFIRNKTLEVLEKTMGKELCDCGGEYQYKAHKQGKDFNPLFDPWHFTGKCRECDEEFTFTFELENSGRYEVIYQAVKESNKIQGLKQTNSELLERTLGILAEMSRKQQQE